MSPLVTIGVPTYRRPERLRRALAAVSAQTYRDLEIIVSDNASPESDTRRVVEEAAARDPRIVYRRQAQNLGAGGNFTYLAMQATGRYFAWFADDDSSEPTFVARLVETLEANPDVVLAMSDVVQLDEAVPDRQKLVELSTIRVDAPWPPTRERFFQYPTSNIFFCVYGIYRTDVLQQCRLDFSSVVKGLHFGSEVPFLAEVATHGRIVSIPEPLKIYVTHKESVYAQEMAGLRRLDSVLRHLEIRALVSLAAARSELGPAEKLRLATLPWHTFVKKLGRRAGSLASRITRVR